MEEKDTIIIYTDGACSGNPGPGGWGCLLMTKQHVKGYSGGEINTTNNRMELQAVIEALQRIKPSKIETFFGIQIYSDSTYVIDAINKKWIDKWMYNDWFKDDKQKEPVKNKDLWTEVISLVRQIPLPVEWIKVKGHADNPWNNLCDKMARQIITHFSAIETLRATKG